MNDWVLFGIALLVLTAGWWALWIALDNQFDLYSIFGSSWGDIMDWGTILFGIGGTISLTIGLIKTKS